MAPQQGKIFLNRGVELNVGDSFDSDTVLEYMPTTGKYGLPLDSFTYTVYADGFDYSESEATIFCFVERANDPPQLSVSSLSMKLKNYGILNVDEASQLSNNALEKSTIKLTAGTLKGNRGSVLSLPGDRSQVEFEARGDRGLRKGVHDAFISFQGTMGQINNAMESIDVLTFPHDGLSETEVRPP